MRPYLGGAFLLWIGIWLGINTGPWRLRFIPTGLLSWVHLLRTLFPLVALPVCGILASGLRNTSREPLPRALRFWTGYGVIGLAAGLIWPASLVRGSLMDPAYWAVAYLSVIACAWACLQGGDALTNAIRLNRLSWLVAMAFLVSMVIAARGAIFKGSGLDATGYGVMENVGSVADVPVSRSTGVARFFAVPAILCFILSWRRSGWEKGLWAAAALVCGGMVYVMQSRGSIIGLGAAVGFSLLFLGHRARFVGVVLLVIILLALALEMVPPQVVAHLTQKYATARAGILSGRTRAWSSAVTVIQHSPVWGWGMQADREFVHEHAHNTYLYGLLTSGIAGGTLFVLGLVHAWRQLIRLIRNPWTERLGQGTTLRQAGALLAFFTARGLAEVSGTVFGIDYMMMAAAIAYLGVLERRVGLAVRAEEHA